MNKNLLRDRFREIRGLIKNKDIKSGVIIKKVIESDMYKNSKVISLYCNLWDEVDTISLIKYSLKAGKKVVLPAINGCNMFFYEIKSLDDIKCVNKFGIKEPVIENNLINREDIDLMIIPGICFDKLKNRVGFGNGYYDRYLEGNSNIIKLGICFEEQILKDEYILASNYDIKMDFIITDKEIY